MCLALELPCASIRVRAIKGRHRAITCRPDANQTPTSRRVTVRECSGQGGRSNPPCRQLSYSVLFTVVRAEGNVYRTRNDLRAPVKGLVNLVQGVVEFARRADARRARA